MKILEGGSVRLCGKKDATLKEYKCNKKPNTSYVLTAPGDIISIHYKGHAGFTFADFIIDGILCDSHSHPSVSKRSIYTVRKVIVQQKSSINTTEKELKVAKLQVKESGIDIINTENVALTHHQSTAGTIEIQVFKNDETEDSVGFANRVAWDYSPVEQPCSALKIGFVDQTSITKSMKAKMEKTWTADYKLATTFKFLLRTTTELRALGFDAPVYDFENSGNEFISPSEERSLVFPNHLGLADFALGNIDTRGSTRLQNMSVSTNFSETKGHLLPHVQSEPLCAWKKNEALPEDNDETEILSLAEKETIVVQEPSVIHEASAVEASLSSQKKILVVGLEGGPANQLFVERSQKLTTESRKPEEDSAAEIIRHSVEGSALPPARQVQQIQSTEIEENSIQRTAVGELKAYDMPAKKRAAVVYSQDSGEAIERSVQQAKARFAAAEARAEVLRKEYNSEKLLIAKKEWIKQLNENSERLEAENSSRQAEIDELCSII